MNIYINFFKSSVAKYNFYGMKVLDSLLFYGVKFAGRFFFPMI